MVRTLTSACCSVVHLPAWSVSRLLRWIAMRPSHVAFCALIDTGALVTGMTNVEVARFLLDAGLPHVDGCVVFDHRGRKVVVMRSSKRPVPLHRCGLKQERLFTFFDQV